MSSTHNSRASLLAGLRTGGVRSARFQPSLYSDKDDFPVFVDSNPLPVSAAVDGSNNRFAHQQAAQMPLNPNSVPFTPAPYSSQKVIPQNQAFQMQLLQIEMMRIQSQALQAQQLQAELVAQAQRQQHHSQAQAQAREWRVSLGFPNAPATAAPHVTAFDLRSATLSAQMRRANQAEQLRAQLGLTSPAEEQVPMTAALGGRFGGRTANASAHLSRYIPEEPEEYVTQLSMTPGSTTTPISGVGNHPSDNITPTTLPSRSDQVSNWRRNGNNNVGLGYRAVSSPAVKVTPPVDHQRISPPPGITVTSPTQKGRPQPLTIFPARPQPLVTVAAETTDGTEEHEVTSSGSTSLKSSNISSPTTPRSLSSPANHEPQLSPREEATKKLYEGLGIGRPVSAVSNSFEQPQQFYNFPISYSHPQPAQVAHNHRLVSQPTRQPRGPPSGADELGPKNFATRIRRQAIGGLGILMGARERRESFVEAY
ncbi:hypothetical protein APHAL10511_002142 [Amanita phalloides]|nr:hypothetical protein APHAL10511_002142 [Amanita phalloides]